MRKCCENSTKIRIKYRKIVQNMDQYKKDVKHVVEIRRESYTNMQKHSVKYRKTWENMQKYCENL
jgi:hypothetical protein